MGTTSIVEQRARRQKQQKQPLDGGARILLVLALVMQSVSAGFIDMDTPLDKRTTTSLVDGSVYDLVMSDEFNVPNRSFKDGHDPVWTALDKSDDDSSSAGGGSLHFYNSSWITTTEEGMLKIRASTAKTEWDRFDRVKQEWKHEKTGFKSGMLQSWEKFCFTGGILEVDIIFPGDAFIGGMWPAVWLLGNLGRATYEASTNNIWPWSFDKCDRDLQPAQTISACNEQNHYGLHPFQGRGATEIDLIEVMTGDSGGPLPSTDPPIEIPYADFTLQVAPGIKTNRPQSGGSPVRTNKKAANGHVTPTEQTWYDGLVMKGNTSINPFFYGTYLGETKPNEPVTRTKKQAFQADAVGAIHQLTAAHFNTTHTFRLEWQPGPGGRLDWFAKSHKRHNANGTYSMEGDGLGEDWVHAFSLKDESLTELMGSQIPNEPSSLILNLAISSTWGFPYDVPKSCEKCFDCTDPKCACNFDPGFCSQMKGDGVAMYVDHIRVYQSNDPSAHVGDNHTLGCDPPAYPTAEWIEGHQYRYMRNPPFSAEDKLPIRRVQKGGGLCASDADCGYNVVRENLTSAFADMESTERKLTEKDELSGRGTCVKREDLGAMFASVSHSYVCKCKTGFTGPHCMAQAHFDGWPSAKAIRLQNSPFTAIANLEPTPFMMAFVLCLAILLVIVILVQVTKRKETRSGSAVVDGATKLDRPKFNATGNPNLVITGRSV
eukprot:CAMPEP_0119010080 /NCGR_PEP_ID=MMETSP1176-20130426/4779_1 /TAXON_ID=265551 /ORGANISM="Synedropsis recta cf, Strain CCMP1620" /LENGTH=714 /DNA_ID=CAMNT_0006962689 /DNA_START=104 /DNA_END=2248 /DNA_ORIENTATION=+